jgi:hypothetical protein
MRFKDKQADQKGNRRTRLEWLKILLKSFVAIFSVKHVSGGL